MVLGHRHHHKRLSIGGSKARRKVRRVRRIRRPRAIPLY